MIKTTMSLGEDIWELIHAGKWYSTHEPSLVAQRSRAKQLCWQLNQFPLSTTAERNTLLQRLLPHAADVNVGSDFYCDYGVNIISGAALRIASKVVILDGTTIRFGDNVTIEEGVVITSVTHPVDIQQRKQGLQRAMPIWVGDNVTLGAHSTLLPGAIIANGAKVDVNSVVLPTSEQDLTLSKGNA